MTKVPGSEQRFPCDLCFLALGFLGPENAAIESLKLKQDARSNILADTNRGERPYKTSVDRVYAAGDCRRGQSLIAVSYTHSPSPRDATLSRMPSSA